MIYPFRYDYLRLSGEDLPDETKVADGSTCYIVDTGKLYLAYKGEWYDQDFEESGEE